MSSHRLSVELDHPLRGHQLVLLRLEVSRVALGSY